MIKLKSLLRESVNVEDPSFKQWFGNSKVVDEEGNPKIVYHGSNAKFTRFDLSYTTGQLGFHVGTKEQAENIRTNVNYVYALYASIKNPIRLDDLGSWYGEHVVMMVNKAANLNLHLSASDRTIREALKRKGYDGVVYENRFEGDGDSYIAFEPDQLKFV